VLAPGGGPYVGFDTPQDFATAQTPTQSKRLLNQRLTRRLNSYKSAPQASKSPSVQEDRVLALQTSFFVRTGDFRSLG
jgi:hypothetical protein